MDQPRIIAPSTLSPAAQALLEEIQAVRHQSYRFDFSQAFLLPDRPECKVAVCLSPDRCLAAIITDDLGRQRVFAELYCISQGMAYVVSNDYYANSRCKQIDVRAGAAPHELMRSLFKSIRQSAEEALQLAPLNGDIPDWFLPARANGILLSGLDATPSSAKLDLHGSVAGDILAETGLWSEGETLRPEQLIRRLGELIEEQPDTSDTDSNILPFVRKAHRMLATRLGMSEVAAQPAEPTPPHPTTTIDNRHPARRFAWIPKSKPGDGPLTASKFGGTPWLAADETWPCCEVCGNAMQLFVQVNFAELLDADGRPVANGLLQMFHCVSDAECDQEGGWEPFPAKAMKRVRIVYPEVDEEKAQPLPSFDYGVPLRQVVAWQRLDDFPEESEDGADKFTARRHVLDDKVFGWPSWLQCPEYPHCPVCGENMRFLMQVGNAANLDYMWGDAGTAYLFDCPEHPEQATMLWQCH